MVLLRVGTKSKKTNAERLIFVERQTVQFGKQRRKQNKNEISLYLFLEIIILITNNKQTYIPEDKRVFVGLPVRQNDFIEVVHYSSLKRESLRTNIKR